MDPTAGRPRPRMNHPTRSWAKGSNNTSPKQRQRGLGPIPGAKLRETCTEAACCEASTPRLDSRPRQGPQADVAQLVEQLTRNEQVVRSNRIVGSTFLLGIPSGGIDQPVRELRRPLPIGLRCQNQLVARFIDGANLAVDTGGSQIMPVAMRACSGSAQFSLARKISRGESEPRGSEIQGPFLALHPRVWALC